MIKAQEARELATDYVQLYCDELEKLIRKAAEDKNFEVVVRKNPYSEWLKNGHPEDKNARETIEILQKNGFRVSYFYEERQFVDTGLKISWKKEDAS